MLLTRKMFRIKEEAYIENQKGLIVHKDLEDEDLELEAIAQIKTSNIKARLGEDWIRITVPGEEDLFIDGVTDNESNLKEAFLEITEAIENQFGLILDIVADEDPNNCYEEIKLLHGITIVRKIYD